MLGSMKLRETKPIYDLGMEGGGGAVILEGLRLREGTHIFFCGAAENETYKFWGCEAEEVETKHFWVVSVRNNYTRNYREKYIYLTHNTRKCQVRIGNMIRIVKRRRDSHSHKIRC